MSWSVSIPSGPVETFAERAKEAYYKALDGIRKGNADGVAQAESALRHAISIVADGVAGRGDVSASLSGHGNPNHQPVKVGGADTVQVSVQNTTKYVEPPKAEESC